MALIGANINEFQSTSVISDGRTFDPVLFCFIKRQFQSTSVISDGRTYAP